MGVETNQLLLANVTNLVADPYRALLSELFCLDSCCFGGVRVSIGMIQIITVPMKIERLYNRAAAGMN